MSSTMDASMDEGREERKDVPISASYPGGTNPNMHAMSTGSVKNHFFTVSRCTKCRISDKNSNVFQNETDQT